MDPADLGAELLTTTAALNRWASGRADMETTPAQARLLALIEDLAPVRTTTLAAAYHSSQPALTEHVNRLARAGWVSRSPDPDDGRATLLAPTPEGRALLARVREARKAAIAPLIERLSPTERAELARGIAVVHRLMALTAAD